MRTFLSELLYSGIRSDGYGIIALRAHAFKHRALSQTPRD
jgi:hypothetical protein